MPPEDNNLYIAADGTGDVYSVQRALDEAKEGQVLMVSPGEYREVLNVEKRTSLFEAIIQTDPKQSSSSTNTLPPTVEPAARRL